jgi:nucleoside 2-deoxyribosyltransferase
LIKVYLAGPLTLGDRVENVRTAIVWAEYLASKGFAPYVPHLSHYWDRLFPREYKFWLDYDRHWLEACDCLLRIPGESPGANQEMQWAIEMGKPVFLDYDALAAHYA